MTNILIKNLKDDEYYKGEDIPEKYYSSFLGYGALDTKFLIKVECLIDILRR